ncbi:MAG: hypothetical protein GY896_17730 [Gammaproteobacteria bacterium]|nr:hypothetical protein [Gammaproteobacteria bacterium]
MFAAVLFNRSAGRHMPGRNFRFAILGVGLTGLAAVGATAHAFEQLNAAQNLVYGTAHLSNTRAGQQIIYRYRSQKSADDIVKDRVLLSVSKSHDDDKRDVVLDFLSAERHMPLPDFNGFRGNPVIIVMLEHIAQGFGRETGGGVLYFRNRIRDALAKDSTSIEEIKMIYDTRTINAKRVSFAPFVDDSYLAEKPEYTGARFSIILSAEVQGGVVSIAVKSGQNNVADFERELVFEKIIE